MPLLHQHRHVRRVQTQEFGHAGTKRRGRENYHSDKERGSLRDDAFRYEIHPSS